MHLTNSISMDNKIQKYINREIKQNAEMKQIKLMKQLGN